MALISIPNTFTVGAVIVASQHNSNFSVIYSDYNGNITSANIASNAAILDTQLNQISTAGKVSGAALTSLASIPSGAGFVPIANIASGTANSTTYIAGDQTLKTFGYPYIKITNTLSSGSQGGAATSGAWRVIALNTTDTDTGSNVVSLSSNTIVLVAGTYDIIASCPFYETNSAQTRLQNTTDSTTILIGTTERADSSVGCTSKSITIGRFTIAASKNIQFQYQVQTTNAVSGLGTPGSFGNEIYAQMQLYRIN